MMEKKYGTKIPNPNEPAFPLFKTFPGDDNEMVTVVQPGMTLRDWFAGQALAGILSILAHPDSKPLDTGIIASDCYDYADAMLTARDK